MMNIVSRSSKERRCQWERWNLNDKSGQWPKIELQRHLRPVAAAYHHPNETITLDEVSTEFRAVQA
ncbi:hypothetical protein B0H19DRAFT_203878 [Mycena capillaripes]|nr:hypothetical protein B0H19DRAFT_203878 [Mycena capillaripes]